ncbi:MAG TPA: LamG-like jellyroll fold domain-containing protein, partial [Microthrixaceae bacterium]|nr:LamG-like jellyroll fold domain-containing protein [Microthrixaceae bacterium]
MRDEMSRTVLNSDGSKTTTIQTERLNYRAPDGSWEPIDTTIETAPDGVLQNAGDSWRYRFRSLGSGGVEVTTDEGKTFSFTTEDTVDVSPLVGDDGQSVVYPNVWPGADLRYEVTVGGLKEVVVLKDAKAATSFAFRLDGATLTTDDKGARALALDGGGRVAMSDVVVTNDEDLPFPDAVAKGELKSDAGLARDPSGADESERLVLSVDPQFVATLSADQFPILVDPSTITRGAGYWSYYQSNGVGNCNVTAPSGCVTRVGSWAGQRGRSFHQFGIEDFQYRNITYANLSAYPSSGLSGLYSTNFQVWDANEYVGWAPCEAVGFVCIEHLPGEFAGGSMIPAGLNFDVTSRIQYYAETGDTPYGRAPMFAFNGYETSDPTRVTFFSAGMNLQITWNDAPSRSQLAPASWAQPHTLTPALTGGGSDPDGDQMWAHFWVCPTPELWGCTPSGWVGAFPSGGSTSWTVPAGVMSWNRTYYWFLQTQDGVVGSEVAGPWAITPSQSPPPTPSLGSLGLSVTTSNPALALSGPVVDPDGDLVKYRFVVATGSDGQTGRLVDSGVVASTSWSMSANSLPDGVYYWTAQACDDKNACSAWAAPQQFRVDLRLGVRDTLPFDTAGPVSVNLSTGNLVTASGGPSFETIDGSVGVGFTYNSRAVTPRGLTASFYDDPNGNAAIDSGEARRLTRVDPQVAFHWGSPGEGPAPGSIKPESFNAKWTGTIRPPAGSYRFRVDAGGTNNTVSLNVNNTGTVTGTGVVATGPISAPGTAMAITATYGMRVSPSLVRLQRSTDGGLTWGDVPADWLAPTETVLPDGWATTGPGLGTATYTRLTATETQVTLTDASGASHVWVATGGGFVPPAEEDGSLSRMADGSWSLADDDGYTYQFDHDGQLVRMDSPSDVLHPGASSYTYGTYGAGPGIRLTKVTDAFGRAMDLVYGGHTQGGLSCPGGNNAPVGMLCQVRYTGFKRMDNSAIRLTDLIYSNGYLVQVMNPGGARTDFHYDAATAKLDGIRDVATNDLVADQVFSSGITPDAHFWQIAYDAQGRVSSVTYPEPSASATRPRRSYIYPSATVARVVVDGLTNASGWTQEVTMDAFGRPVSVKDQAGLAVDTEWDPTFGKDRPIRVRDHHYDRDTANGLISTTIYDESGLPVDRYGPGTQAELGTSLTSPTAPRSTTAYDENIFGLAGKWWPNTTMGGPPSLYTTFDGDEDWAAGGPTNPAFGSANVGSDGFSGALTGQYTAAGGQTFGATADGARVFIDDVKVADSWGGPYRSTVNLDAPVGYWRLGEPSGATTATDSVGGLSGTYTNVALGSAQPGALGNGTAADGDTAAGFTTSPASAMSVSPPASGADRLNLAGDMAIDGWVYPTVGGTYKMIATKAIGNGGATNAFEFRINPSNQLEFVQVGNGYTYVTQNVGTIALNASTHVAVTRVNGLVTLYSGGSPVGSANLGHSAGATGATMRLGAREDGYQFSGRLDEIAIYDHGLSGARVAAHAVAGAGGAPTVSSAGGYQLAVREDSPDTWYRFDDSTGAGTLTDSSAAGANAATFAAGYTRDPNGATAGESNGSWTLNGSASVQLPTGELSNPAFSVEAWFKTSSNGAIMGVHNGSPTTTSPSNHVPLLYVGTDGKL